MTSSDLSKHAMELPVEERLELARQLVESVVTPESMTNRVREGIQRIEDIAVGRVAGMSETEFRNALQ